MTDMRVITYVTADGIQWLNLNKPHGLISPPTITLHQPSVGPVVFYNADGYQLNIPKEARSRG